MTDAFETFKNKMSIISEEIQFHVSGIVEDDVIDLNEATETQVLVKKWKSELNRIKKEMRLVIRKIKSEYKLEIANSYGTYRKRDLRRAQANEIAPFEKLINILDSQLLNLENINNLAVESLETIREIEANQKSEKIEDANYIEIEITDFIKVLKKWKAIQAKAKYTIETSNSPKLVMKVEGFYDAIGVAISDLESILPENIFEED